MANHLLSACHTIHTGTVVYVARNSKEKHESSVNSLFIGTCLFFLLCRCTINPGENEALVRYALDTYKFLSLVSQVSSIICKMGWAMEQWINLSIVQTFHHCCH